MHYGISAAAAYEMSIDKAYQELKCQDAGALSYDVTIEQGVDGAVLHINRKLPSDEFPPLLRKLMPAGVSATETVTWGPIENDGARTAKLTVDFHSSPADLQGTIRIVPAGPDESDVYVSAEFKAHVPLMGRKVEKAALPIVTAVIDGEEVTGKAWVAGRR